MNEQPERRADRNKALRTNGLRTRLRTLPPGRQGELRARVRRYQRFRRARARLVKLHAQMVVLIDALEAGRRAAP